MKNTSRFLLLLVVFGMLLAAGNPAAAASLIDQIVFDATTGYVTIEGVVEGGGGVGVIQVFKPGKGPSDLQTTTPDTLLQVLQYTDEIEINPQGAYHLEYRVVSTEGWHDVYLYAQDGRLTYTGRFYYMSETTAADIIDDINKNATTKEKMEEAILQNNIDFQNEVYDELLKFDAQAAFMTEVYTALVNERPFVDIQDLKAKLNRELVVQRFRYAASSGEALAILQSNAAQLQFDTLKTYAETFANVLSEEQQLQIVSLLHTNPCTSYHEFSTVFCENTILRAVNGIYNWMLLRPILYDNEQQLTGFNMKGYLALGSAKQEQVDRALLNGTYASFAALKNRFNELVTSASSSAQGGGSGGGGGGGGGSSGNSAASIGNYNYDGNHVSPAIENTPAFSDLSAVPWAVQSIESLYSFGIVDGRQDGRFYPDEIVSREEFIKMLVLSMDIYDAQAVADFSDVDHDAWYAPYIASAVNHGISQGISDDAFGVGLKIKRQDMATLLYRAVMQLLPQEKPEEELQLFDDDALISDYAKTAVYAIKNAGMIDGVGNNLFAPQEYATRAQAAKVLYEFLVVINQ